MSVTIIPAGAIIGDAAVAGYRAGWEHGYAAALDRPGTEHAEQYPRPIAVAPTGASLAAQLQAANRAAREWQGRYDEQAIELARVREHLADAIRQLGEARVELTKAGPAVEYGDAWIEYAPEIDTDGEPPLIVGGMLSARYRKVIDYLSTPRREGIDVAITWMPAESDRRGTGTHYTITLPAMFRPADAEPTFVTTTDLRPTKAVSDATES